MRVALADLNRLHAPIRAAIDEAIARVVDSGRFVGGEEVVRFERRFAEWVGASHAVAVSSGTDALLASLMALGVGPGDEVVTTALSFAATAQAIARLGAAPVCVDVDERTYNIDPACIETAIGPRTVGILPVHLFGQAADMTALSQIAERHGLWILEDAAQALGARWEGRHAGTFGAAGCFSFFPTKTLGALGDGGMIVTDDEELAETLRRVRHHGAEPKYVHHHLGGNFRLDALQAAVLDVKLDHLEEWLSARRRNAELYEARLPAQIRPHVAPAAEHAWHQYVVWVDERDRIAAHLRQADVETAVYYPSTLADQPCFASDSHPDVSAARRATQHALAIPVGPELESAQVQWVAARLVEAL